MYCPKWAYCRPGAGAILARTQSDLGFDNKTVRVNKSADDNTQLMRQPKTKVSVALLPMPSAFEAMLLDYIRQWKSKAGGFLFPTRNGLRPRSRDNVVKIGLRPVLQQARHSQRQHWTSRVPTQPATELVESNAPLTVLQRQMRHANIATTLGVLHARHPAKSARCNGGSEPPIRRSKQ